MKKDRDFFRYTQAVAYARKSLKTPTLRDRFITGVEDYALKGDLPDFSDCPELENAFASVWGGLEQGLIASAKGTFGNGVKAANAEAVTADPEADKPTKKAKARKKPRPSGAAMAANVDITHVDFTGETEPPHTVPTASLTEYLEKNGLPKVAALPPDMALCAEEIRWLERVLGRVVLSGLLYYMEALNNLEERLKKSELTAFRACIKHYKFCEASFDDELSIRCPKLYDKPANMTAETWKVNGVIFKLCFAQYHRLRVCYGRANVWRAMVEIGHWKMFKAFQYNPCESIITHITKRLNYPEESKHRFVSAFDETGSLLPNGGYNLGNDKIHVWERVDEKFRLPIEKQLPPIPDNVKPKPI